MRPEIIEPMSVRRITRLLAAMLPAFALALPMPAPAAGEIGPGRFMSAPEGCTMNFVFTDGNRLFVGTAGHCSHTVGERASAPGIGEFGTIVYRRLEGNDDFALIRIDASKEANVDPTVPRWGGPSGVTVPADTLIGDPIALYGWGTGFSIIEPTRSRAGLLAADGAQHYVAELPAVFGDSGGPIVHIPTGKALGIVSGIRAVEVPQGTLWGTTVQRALSLVIGAGFNVDLVEGAAPLL